MIKEKRLDEWHGYWLSEMILWLNSIGLSEIKVREHKKDELSHYSSATFDIDYEYPFGSKEIAGIANRGQYDLNQHIKESKQSLEIFDEKTQKRIIPRVIEPTFGVERTVLAILCDAYTEEEDRIVLKLDSKVAPIKVAVFPLLRNKPELVKKAREIFDALRVRFACDFDDNGNVGKRYRRQDEIGTPYCVTVDFDSLEDGKVTVRDRDSMAQERVAIAELPVYLGEKL